MRFQVKVIPNAKQAKVDRVPGGLRVKVDAPARDGRANERLLEILAKHFRVKRSQVYLVQGARGREKIVEVAEV